MDMKGFIVAAVAGTALAICAAGVEAQTGPVSPKPTPSNPSNPVTPAPGNPALSSPVNLQTSPATLGGGSLIHLKNAVIQNNAGAGKALSPGFNNLDGMQRLTCTTTCTINVSAMVQVSTTGRWAICAVV